MTYHRASLGKAIVLRSRPAQVGLMVAATLGCRSPLSSSDDARAAVPAPTAAQKSVSDAGTSATSSTAYPVDSSPPRDFFSDALLRTLNREAAARVVCTLTGLTDVFGDRREPDTFYDAACDVTEVQMGSIGLEPLHFVWQVERGSRMPPPGAELLVYLKARKEPLDRAPYLKWVALDTGVMRYTDALRRKLRQRPDRQKRK